ncbi:Uncharacterised protein [Salmonella enterica subsp. arizonae]|uniref:Uncharacterized protein n=1 Tax=Salmonella enterica subsp. arizonae TaxID=59203 RepID=A0A379SP71_SALER|nr:Uncharacterised protein [Salmonella enterica subsp. arizonae]
MGNFLFFTVCALRQLFQNSFQERAFQGVVTFSDRGAQQITDGRDESEQSDDNADGGAILRFRRRIVAAACQHPANQRAAKRQAQLEHKQRAGKS